MRHLSQRRCRERDHDPQTAHGLNAVVDFGGYQHASPYREVMSQVLAAVEAGKKTLTRYPMGVSSL